MIAEVAAQAPLVSVIVSAYQLPAFLNEALRSVTAQTYRNVEIIVVDDASGAEYTDQYELPAGAKLLVHPERRATAAMSRNAGLRVAHGKYVAFLDQDDVWVPEKLAWQVEILERDPQVVLVFGHYRRVDETLVAVAKQAKPRIVRRDALRQLIRRNIVHCPSQVMMRRESFERIGPFDEGIRGAADWDMWIRAAAAGRIVGDPRVMTLYRQHAKQWSKQRLMMVKGSSRVMEKTAEWTSGERRDLRWMMKMRRCRWLGEVARAQMESGEERGQAFGTLRQAIRIWPLGLRPYWLMARAMVQGNSPPMRG